MAWYTREEATPGDFGEMPEKRSIEDLMEKGFFLIDKPFGPTSNQVSHWVKEELNLEKTGHFGTLDPNATGVLPVGINSGTRIQDALSNSDKDYVFEAKLSEKVEEETIREDLNSFEGVNEQTPPKHSAVKKEAREREVYEVEIIEAEGKKLLARVKCESGFYVRVLIKQLGEKLGVEAEMEELRRTGQGGFSEKDLNTLHEVVDAYHFYRQGEEKKLREVLHPIEHAVKHLNKLVIKDSAVNAVANGSNLGATGISKLEDGIEEDETVAIMTLKGELVALAEATMTSEEMYESEDTAAELVKVFMNPDKYPKRWKQ